MKKTVFLILTGIIFMFTAVAGAAELKVPDWIKEVDLNGFASVGYNYDFNEPHSRNINFRPFNNRDNTFGLELAQLVFHKDAAAPGSTGFNLDLNYGYTVPAAIHSTGQSSSGDFDVKQAFISYVAPIGSGLKLDAGKFITEFGAEVIEGYAGWNYNYSRSLLFYYTIPYTHTGLRGTYVFNDRLTLIGCVANGWDNVTDNNGGKSVFIHAAMTPAANTTLNVKYIVGPEQNDNNNNLRHVLNLNFGITVLEKLVFSADYVYGSEKNVPGIGDSDWTGIAGVFRYPVSDKLAMSLRAEFFNDSDGARTGTMQDMWEFTFTPEYAINGNMLVRAEYRHDQSDKNVFDGKDAGDKKHQDTLGMNLIYHF